MIVLVGIGITYILYNTFYTWSESFLMRKGSAPHLKLGRLLSKKPFSCQFCLSFWVAIGFFLTTNIYPAFIIPVGYELTRLLIKKL